MKRKSAGLSVGFLFDDTLDSTDGVAQHVKTLGAWLSAEGHKVSYLVGETKSDDWAGGKVYSLAGNVGVNFNGNKLSVPLYSKKTELKHVLEEENFDVLHVMVPYSPFMSQRVINLAPKSTAIVGTFHIFPSGFLSRYGTHLLRMVYGKSLKRFGAMISVSPPAANFCKQTLGISSVVIPNPVKLSAFSEAVVPIVKYKRIVFLGRLVKRKGCEQLIKAFAALDMPNARLVVAGSGPKRPQLEQLAKKSGVNRSVSFLGRIDETDKPDLLASADVACFPSLYGESFGIVLVEAMAAGAKTVLGGDNPGYRSVLGDKPVCLVDPNDTKAFSEKLRQLLTNEKIRSEIRTWQEKSVNKYDIDVVGPQVENVYLQAIARTNKKSHNRSHE